MFFDLSQLPSGSTILPINPFLLWFHRVHHSDTSLVASRNSELILWMCFVKQFSLFKLNIPHKFIFPDGIQVGHLFTIHEIVLD